MKFKIIPDNLPREVSSIGLLTTDNYICVAINGSYLYTMPINNRLLAEHVRKHNIIGNNMLVYSALPEIKFNKYKVNINMIKEIRDNGEQLEVILKNGKAISLK